jgi:hypothetical protein
MHCQRHNFDRLVVCYWANRRQGRSPQKIFGMGEAERCLSKCDVCQAGAFSPCTTCKFCWQAIAVVGANEGPAEES